MFCKVCQDAGKTEKEYTAHSLRSRDRNGTFVVTCPLLLQTECRFCYTKGHTAQYCPAIAAKNKERGGANVFPEIRVQAKEQKNISDNKQIQLPLRDKTVFPSLTAPDNMDSSDDEYEATVQIKSVPNTQPRWADIANVEMKPVFIPQAKSPDENYTILTQPLGHNKTHGEDEKPTLISIPTTVRKIKWEDIVSSDDDNYDSDDCYTGDEVRTF